MYPMLEQLAKMQKERRQKLNVAGDFKRKELLRKHKRVHDIGSPYASKPARYFLKEQAVILWGDEWAVRLHKLFEKMNHGNMCFWDAENIPSKLHYQVTEAVKAMVLRAAKNKAHG